MIPGTHNLMLDVARLIPLALRPMERMKAMGDWEEPAGGQIWLVVFLALALVLVALGVVALAMVRHWRRMRRQREALAALCQEYDLSDRQRYVMAAIVKAARIRQVETVFTVSMSFERGLAALMRSPTVTGMSQQKQQEVRELVESVRLRLGLQTPEIAAGGEGGQAPSDHPGAVPAEPGIARGDRLMVVHRGVSATFDVDVAAAGAEEFLVQPLGEVDTRPGETWLLRYAKDGALWEFDAPVMGTEGGQVRLGRPSRPRFINRRRFPRVATSKPAQVANFPFTRSDLELSAPDMVDGELTEIAGPGLRVEAPIQVVPGDRVLLALQLGDNNVVEGLGKVRRAKTSANGDCVLVVELLGLTSEEMARMAHETNAAAREASNDFAPRDSRGALSLPPRDVQEAPPLPSLEPQGVTSQAGKEP